MRPVPVIPTSLLWNIKVGTLILSGQGRPCGVRRPQGIFGHLSVALHSDSKPHVNSGSV